jgi:hypothetical protein
LVLEEEGAEERVGGDVPTKDAWPSDSILEGKEEGGRDLQGGTTERE